MIIFVGELHSITSAFNVEHNDVHLYRIISLQNFPSVINDIISSNPNSKGSYLSSRTYSKA